MAIVNPQLDPNKPPEYLKDSRAPSTPNFMADTSTGLALSGIGDVLGKGLKATDEVVQVAIGDQLHQNIDREREGRRKELEDVEAALKPKVASAAAVPTPGAADPDLVPIGTTTDPHEGKAILPSAPQNPLPKSLTQLPGSLSALDNAKANGKLSDTAYMGRLDLIAKDFRARFPGYRDYIDDRIKHITGVDPANAYIKSIESDINTRLTNANKTQEHFESWARTHMGDLDGQGPLLIAATRSGAISDVQAFALGQRRIVEKATMDYNIKVAATLKADAEIRKNHAERAIVSHLDNKVSQGMENFLIINELGKEEKFASFMERYSTGQAKIDSVQAERIAGLIVGEKARSMNEQKSQLSKVYPGDPSRSPVSDLGGTKEFDDYNTRAHSPYDIAYDQMKNQHHGAAYATAAITTAQNSEDVKAVLKNPAFGPALRVIGVVNKQSGPNTAAQIMARVMSTGKFTPSESVAIVAQFAQMSNEEEFTRHFGRVITPKESLEDGRKVPGLEKPAYNKLISDFPSRVISSPDASDAQKLGVADGAFDKANDGFLKKFDRDHFDEYGNRTTGRNWVFQNWGDRKVADEMFRLGASRPGVWEKYTGWMSRNFQSEIFNTEINDLKNLATNPNVKLEWNDKTHNFTPKFGLDVNPQGKPVSPNPNSTEPFDYSGRPFGRSGLQMEQDKRIIGQSIARLNSGITSIANIYKASGLDDKAVNAYVLTLLQNSGGDSGIVKQMFQRVYDAAEASSGNSGGR